jgi:hypothetical protein
MNEGRVIFSFFSSTDVPTYIYFSIRPIGKLAQRHTVRINHDRSIGRYRKGIAIGDNYEVETDKNIVFSSVVME